MFIKEYKLLDSCETWPLDISKEQALFFDIETTGLSPKNSHIYIIGCGYYRENHWFIKQWFAESSSEEFLLLEEFFSFAKAFDTLITYNGISFDLPYTKEKAKGYLLEDILPIKTLDLYREVKPLKKLFSIQSLHQTNIERFLGLHREDKFSGKELINVYRNYRKSPDNVALHQLLLHNKEDMSGMLTCLRILSYVNIFAGQFQYSNGTFEINKCIFTFTLTNAVPKEFTFDCPQLNLHMKDDIFIVTLPVKENKLKYYFPDYENYVILQDEHTVLPKIMAKSASMQATISATLETCYQEISVTEKLLSNEKKIVSIVSNYLKWLLRNLKETI